MSSKYLHDMFLETAGLSDFPDQYEYLRDIKLPQKVYPAGLRVSIGEQTLQQQVKDNDDALTASQPSEPPTTPTKIDLSSQLERQNFLATSGSDPQLIVYGDRVTLTASYATTGLFPSGYLFKSYPEQARPKQGDKVIALVGSDAADSLNIFCYIDENGPFIISSAQIPSDTAIVINQTYYKQYEQSKYANYDTNNDGKVDIMDTWNILGNGTFDSKTHVYEVVKKQTELIAQQSAQPADEKRINYLNSDIKLIDELGIYKADRAAFFIKDGPFITFSFGAKLPKLSSNATSKQATYQLFSTISQKLLPSNIKYIPTRTEQRENAAIIQFKDMYDKSQAVQVITSGILGINDCEFAGTYVIDPTYENDSNALPSDPLEPDSLIDEVIMKHEQQLEQVQPPKQQYTITNSFSSIPIDPRFNLYSPALNTFYIVDDGNCKVCVFNLFFVSKGISNERQQVVATYFPDELLPADGKSMAFPATVIRNAGARWILIGMSYFVIEAQQKHLIFCLSQVQDEIPQDSEEVYQYCTSGMYYL
ncbi:MAG: hypothetical protein EZS28_013327 [Streblomastix strix]|uniref:Uncharacterized protein n=1 Tax=Streblomastix strix TaxID=222440 RepID=A0A5J4W8D4_9EUKA|nr:MAG: hypothetical protein EZS28_013327 [Streblomastix strix]